MAAEDLATVAELLVLAPDAAIVGPRASALITVATYPVPSAETVIAAAQNLTLTSVDGARAPGANNYSGNATDADGVATSIRDAINDASNLFAPDWLASKAAGVAAVAVLGKTGPAGDVELVSSDPAITVSGFAGGAAWIDHALEFADCLIDAACWGAWRNKGSIYLAAHFLTLLPNGLAAGTGGNVTGISMGSISKSFANAAPTDPRFGTSAWGKMYLMLAEQVFCSPGGVAGSGGDPLSIVVGC